MGRPQRPGNIRLLRKERLACVAAMIRESSVRRAGWIGRRKALDDGKPALTIEPRMRTVARC
jgi:hypothetical protein